MNPIEELKARLDKIVKAAPWFSDWTPHELSEDAIRLAEIYRKMAYTWDRAAGADTEEFNDREAMKMFKGEK